MRKFIRRFIGFILPVILLFIAGLFIPVTPRASKSLLFSTIMKDSLLQNTEPPRIIFVGGSNLSFGLNCQMIKDSLNLNPINTGVHASIGLRYMLVNTIQYVKEGDIVVLIPEYSHYYKDYNIGSEVLLRTIFDVNPLKIHLLNFRQLLNTVPYMPRYTLSKFYPTEYLNITESIHYSVNSFNKYGDTYTHWTLATEEFLPSKKNEHPYNESVMMGVRKFRSEIEDRKAILIVSYPGFQESSFNNSFHQIKRIEKEYKKNNFRIFGTPEKYMIADSMMFNTPYHLNKNGVDYRTHMFIKDFRGAEVN